MRLARLKFKRLRAAITVQSMARMYFAKLDLYGLFGIQWFAAVAIQRVARGYISRNWVATYDMRLWQRKPALLPYRMLTFVAKLVAQVARRELTWGRDTEARKTQLLRLLNEAEEVLLASPTRQNTGRCISPVSQGHFLDEMTLPSRAETSSPCRSPLPSDPSRAQNAHNCATDDGVGSEVATIPQVFAEEALSSRETPSQQDPKVTFEDTQDLHLVNASPKDVSLEPHRSDANSPPDTHHAEISPKMSRILDEMDCEIKQHTDELEKLPPGKSGLRSTLEEGLAICRKIRSLALQETPSGTAAPG